MKELLTCLTLFLGLLFFLAVFACAPPELDLAQPIKEGPKVTAVCKTVVINRHIHKGAICVGEFIATGLVSISPTKIQCAQIDMACE